LRVTEDIGSAITQKMKFQMLLLLLALLLPLPSSAIDWLAGFSDANARTSSAAADTNLTFTWTSTHNVYQVKFP